MELRNNKMNNKKIVLDQKKSINSMIRSANYAELEKVQQKEKILKSQKNMVQILSKKDNL